MSNTKLSYKERILAIKEYQAGKKNLPKQLKNT